MIFFNLLNLFWHTDKNFCFYAEANFGDFVRNDNSNKVTTARLNETRFGPKKKSSPIYLGPKNLDTFWWNCQIIFRCASLHGSAGFILWFIRFKCKNTWFSNKNLVIKEKISGSGRTELSTFVVRVTHFTVVRDSSVV